MGMILRNKLLDNIISMGRSAGFDERHALDVNIITLTLFDQLQDLHRMGNTERIWLETAALLHDAGKPQNSEIHHKLVMDMIADFSVLPFGKKERNIIGLVARYHRGSTPSEKHKHFAQLDIESRNYVVKLASILRVADGLVSGKSKIKSLICNIRGSKIIIHLNCKKNIPLCKAIKKADLFEQVYGKSLVFNMQLSTDTALCNA